MLFFSTSLPGFSTKNKGRDQRVPEIFQSLEITGRITRLIDILLAISIALI